MRPAVKTAGCTVLPWDSEFWGIRIGRVEGGDLDAARLEAVDAWARSNDVACVYFLASGDDAEAAHVAEGGGFRLMDVRVELRASALPADALRDLRNARSDDAASLRAIARSSHGVTRFYADPHFPDERCDEFYDVWITKSLEDWADVVLVADARGAPAGYVSCHLDAAAATGTIGLIAVDARARGEGIGATLVRGAIGWCHDRGAREMTVVTQARNVPALRTFQRCGFLVDSLGFWFHKWYER